MKKKTGRPAVSNEIKEEAIRMRKAGKTIPTIARKFGLHPQTIFKICKAAGLVRNGIEDSKVIGTLKATIERLVRELQAADERSTGLAVQLDELQEKFNKETSKTWLDRLIGF